MGREARCACRWGARTGHVTLLLERDEVIVRGDFRARVPRADLVFRANGSALEIAVDGESVAFELGVAAAVRWSEALAAPPPALAAKLGIGPATMLHVTGDVDDPALAAALGAGTAAEPRACGLRILRTDDRDALVAWALDASFGAEPAAGWVVYAKGRGAPLGESAVRETMRALGFVDTKVASVSDRLTALRFARKP